MKEQEIPCIECEKPLTDEDIKFMIDRNIPEEEMICIRCFKKYSEKYFNENE